MEKLLESDFKISRIGEPVSTVSFDPRQINTCPHGACEYQQFDFRRIQVSAAQKLRAYLSLINQFEQAITAKHTDIAVGIWKELARYTDDDVKALEALAFNE